MLWLLRRKCRGAALGALIALAALLPVLGLVPFTFQEWSTVADRYMYLAMLGAALAVGTLLARLPGVRGVADLGGNRFGSGDTMQGPASILAGQRDAGEPCAGVRSGDRRWQFPRRIRADP